MANQPDFKQLMNIAQEMQKNMVEVQKNLANYKTTGTAGTGDIKVDIVMNGQQQIEKVIIADGAMQEGKEILQDLIAAATNNAVEKIKEMTKHAMIDIYQKSGMPTGE